MSSLFSLFIFFLCLSMHACHARHKMGFGGQHFHGHQVGKKGKILKMDSDESTGSEAANIEDNISHGGASIATTTNTKKSIEDKEMKHNKEAISGSEIVESSSHMGLQKEIAKEGQAQSVEEFGSYDKDEAPYTTKNSVHEDIAENDYTPAHQKSPIHNRKN